MMISLKQGGNKMERVMKNKWLMILIGLMMLFAVGCSSNNSSKSAEETNEKQDISGVWVGYIGSSFTVGIINENDNDKYFVHFVAQKNGRYNQFISPDGAPLTQQTLNFTGNLLDVTWNTTGLNYSTLSPRTLSVWFSAISKSIIGPLGAYLYAGTNQERGLLFLVYNTTYDVSPNVNNISGQWEIKDAIQNNNNIVLTITPNAGDTKGTVISALDNHGNNFTGTIKIYYSPIDNKPHNVYDVKLTLENSNNSIDLTGLATYVLESSTNGIAIPKKTLAIGATSNDKTYSLNGLANFIE
jgi:hypothetical protein